MSTKRVEIPLEEHTDGELIAGHAGYRLLESVGRETDEQWREDTKRILHKALPYFPELAGRTITVGVLDPDHPRFEAQADWWNDLVTFTPEYRPWVDTVFHELAHLAIWIQYQDGKDVPRTSEPYTSLLAISRMPPDWIERSDIAYLGTPQIPSADWPETCEVALAYRAANGPGSHYVKEAKRLLAVEDEQDRNTGELV